LVTGNENSHLVLVVSLLSRKELIQRSAGLVHLPVDERAAHAVPGGQGADWFRARQGPHGDHLALVGGQLHGCSAGGLLHGGVAIKNGALLSRASPFDTSCVTRV
jgi:hypothetical protein